MDDEGPLTKPAAVVACATMALFYVAILYAPTLILRLPPPSSLNDFMIRRFVCAGVSTVASVFFSAFILSVKSREAFTLFGILCLRLDHIWHAVVFPLFLTSLMYAGSFARKILLLVDSWKEHVYQDEASSFDFIKDELEDFHDWVSSTVSNVLAWRNYVVAPLTEELVFRACMVPLLVCGGFKVYTIVLLCPVFFSLAHLNHWMEVYTRQNYSVLKALLAVGVQLGYTLVFGSYATFLFIRTGHFLAPLVAHVFCNFMGLPVLFVKSKGVITLAFVAGGLAFVWLLFPLTEPGLCNESTNNCRCWHGYCSWN